jgi:hypothetical protein
MSDIVDDLLRLSVHPGVDPKEHRRHIIERLVQTLSKMANDAAGSGDIQHQLPIVRLVGVVKEMTVMIAEADDASFSAIVREAALLVRTLQRRQLEMAKFTIH